MDNARLRREIDRANIVQFCEVPRTIKEVAGRLGVSGISAGAILSYLCCNGFCELIRTPGPRGGTIKTFRAKKPYKS